jgi:hypothetical protein
VRYLGDYRLELKFADGVAGTVDLADWIVGQGGVMSALEDKSFFARVTVNDDIGTVVWPNDVDFDPEVLYGRVTGKAIPGAMQEAVKG